MVIDLIKMLKENEGVRYCAYKDSVGLWTLGCGENIERPGANDRLKSVGVNPDMVWAAIEEAKKAGKSKTVPLVTDKQVDDLLQSELEHCIKDLDFVSGFDSMPDQARAVLIDMRFNLGGKGLRQFKQTLKAFEKGDWRAAADGLMNSAMAKQVPNRVNKNVKLLLSIK
jgi:GH24 family phage-related lysozyme (muramidase)